MILSNDTDTDHDINITAGICRTADNTASMELTSEQTKKIDVNWATGNDAGGIQSGESGVSNTTWYHVHVFTVGATVEVGFDTSITAAGLIANHGGAAGKYRRIGAVLTDGSANILGFTQVGDEFLWDDPPLDINVSSVTSATLYAMSTPLGVRCKVNFNFYLSSLGNSEGAYFTCPDQDDETPAIASPGPVPQSASTNNNGSIIAVGGLASTMTNTSSQVRVDSQDTSFTLTATTLNYIDRRGRDD
jgi:hypothetical protein